MKPRHFVQLLFLSALWGASFLFIRIASPVLGPGVLALLRIGLATATLVLLMLALRRAWPRSEWRTLLPLAVLSVALPFSLYAWAALQLPAGYSALLNCTSVLFGTVAASWLKEDTLTPAKLAGCLCGLLGVALIVRLGPVQPSLQVVLAALACTVAAACYGICTPFMKRATRRIDPLALAAGIHAFAVLMVLPGGLWGWPQAQFTPLALLATAVLGIVASGLAYWMHLRLIQHLSPVAAMSPAFLVPLFGVAWGALFLGEALGPGIYLGGALVLLATALVCGFNPLLRRG
ncbi:MAG: DMT family transporter [Pseudomonadota bacterium]